MVLHLLFRRLLAGGLIMAAACVAAPGVLLAEWAPVTQAEETIEAASLIGGVPFAFVENRGQWDTPASFVARRGGMTARFEQDAMLLQLEHRAEEGQAKGVVVRMAFANASEDVTLEGEQRLPGVCNFFLGHDATKWQADVPRYASVIYRGLYESVDVRVRENAGQLEYDLLLAPGADLSQIVVRCDGVESTELASDGALIMETSFGSLRQRPPNTWYELPSGERRLVECRYRMVGADAYGFEVPESDEALALVIDPTLEWSTYLGGDQDDSPGRSGLAVDDAGLITVVGTTYSSSFPTTAGAYDESYNTSGDVYVARFDPSAQTPEEQLVWSTFLGGSNPDQGNSVALGSAGEVTVVGTTQSPDFPVRGAYAGTHAGGTWDAFAARLDPNQTGDAQLVWSTFLGGTESDMFNDVAVDGSGIVTVTGQTKSENFPVTLGSYDTSYNGDLPSIGWGDGIVVRLDPTEPGVPQLVYSTFIGGSGDDLLGGLALDSGGVVTAAGQTYSNNFPVTPGAYDTSYNGSIDSHVVRLSLDGNGAADLLYASYLGGSNSDRLGPLDMDASGVVTIAGHSNSDNFPTTPGAYNTSRNGGTDGVVLSLRLDGNGMSDLLYSTFLGEASSDYIYAVCVVESGIVSVTGQTNSADYPTTPNADDPTFDGPWDGFLTRLTPTLGSLVYSTFCGGSGADYGYALAHDAPDRIVVFGATTSPDLATPGAYDESHNGNYDVFVCTFGGVATAVPLEQVTTAADESGIWLSPPTPNPARGPVSYRVVLPQEASVRVQVFDVHGHRVESLFDGALGAGSHSFEWDSGRAIPAGVYYLRLEAAGTERTQKIVLIR